MDKEKQIEEIIIDLLTDFDEMGFAPTTLCPDPEAYAIEWREKLTKALKGYRKQSEGEWNDNIIGFCNVCMNCGAIVERSAIKNNSGKLNFCPNCGARMKGGEE